MKFVSYATPSYQPDALELVKTLNQFHLPHFVFLMPSMGGWKENTYYKAVFLYWVLKSLQEPLVWVDADARIRKDPLPLLRSLQKEHVDIAAHYRQDDLGKRLGHPQEGELLSGTLFLNYTPEALRLLEQWIEYNKTSQEAWEQKNLQKVLRENTLVNFRQLPAEFCMITATGAANMGTSAQAVIEHTQASRRLRNARG